MAYTNFVADLVLVGGMVIDGTGSPPFSADVAIKDGSIAAVGQLRDLAAVRRMDASGKIVAPGFIDVHTHDDYACIQNPEMTPKISQGVTTVVVGNCGLSLVGPRLQAEPPEPFNLLGGREGFAYASFGDYARAVEEAGPAVNVAALVGHSTLRLACMDDLHGPASSAELMRMNALLEDALQNGAVGMSSGVYYTPAQAASAEELELLASTVGRVGGVYATHIRDEYDGVAEALGEAFSTAEKGGVEIVVSHHKCAGVGNWGRSEETLGLFDHASRRQVVGMDCYPYTAGSSVLNPELADGQIRILVSSSESVPEAAGRYLDEIAAQWGVSERDAADRLVPGYACFFQIHEDDMHRIIAHDACMVGSDGLPNAENPHPRLWGTFPRVLGPLVRDLKLFPLHEAVYKMTGLSARKFGLQERGVLAVGNAADITVFDPLRIEDRATYENPKQIAAGIDEVFVNGVHTWSSGAATGERGGRFLRRSRS